MVVIPVPVVCGYSVGVPPRTKAPLDESCDGTIHWITSFNAWHFPVWQYSRKCVKDCPVYVISRHDFKGERKIVYEPFFFVPLKTKNGRQLAVPINDLRELERLLRTNNGTVRPNGYAQDDRFVGPNGTVRKEAFARINIPIDYDDDEDDDDEPGETGGRAVEINVSDKSIFKAFTHLPRPSAGKTPLVVVHNNGEADDEADNDTLTIFNTNNADNSDSDSKTITNLRRVHPAPITNDTNTQSDSNTADLPNSVSNNVNGSIITKSSTSVRATSNTNETKTASPNVSNKDSGLNANGNGLNPIINKNSSGSHPTITRNNSRSTPIITKNSGSQNVTIAGNGSSEKTTISKNSSGLSPIIGINSSDSSANTTKYGSGPVVTITGKASSHTTTIKEKSCGTITSITGNASSPSTAIAGNASSPGATIVRNTSGSSFAATGNTNSQSAPKLNNIRKSSSYAAFVTLDNGDGTTTLLEVIKIPMTSRSGGNEYYLIHPNLLSEPTLAETYVKKLPIKRAKCTKNCAMHRNHIITSNIVNDSVISTTMDSFEQESNSDDFGICRWFLTPLMGTNVNDKNASTPNVCDNISPEADYFEQESDSDNIKLCTWSVTPENSTSTNDKNSNRANISDDVKSGNSEGNSVIPTNSSCEKGISTVGSIITSPKEDSSTQEPSFDGCSTSTRIVSPTNSRSANETNANACNICDNIKGDQSTSSNVPPINSSHGKGNSTIDSKIVSPKMGSFKQESNSDDFRSCTQTVSPINSTSENYIITNTPSISDNVKSGNSVGNSVIPTNSNYEKGISTVGSIITSPKEDSSKQEPNFDGYSTSTRVVSPINSRSASRTNTSTCGNIKNHSSKGNSVTPTNCSNGEVNDTIGNIIVSSEKDSSKQESSYDGCSTSTITAAINNSNGSSIDNSSGNGGSAKAANTNHEQPNDHSGSNSELINTQSNCNGVQKSLSHSSSGSESSSHSSKEKYGGKRTRTASAGIDIDQSHREEIGDDNMSRDIQHNDSIVTRKLKWLSASNNSTNECDSSEHNDDDKCNRNIHRNKNKLIKGAAKSVQNLLGCGFKDDSRNDDTRDSSGRIAESNNKASPNVTECDTTGDGDWTSTSINGCSNGASTEISGITVSPSNSNKSDTNNHSVSSSRSCGSNKRNNKSVESNNGKRIKLEPTANLDFDSKQDENSDSSD